MVPEMEKPRITEIKVRMDCNGCVQKIKKALHGITGINDIYIDVPQQKLTIIGWADPEKIVKAIKKTRKSAVICLHTEQPPEQPAQPTPEEEGPPPEATNPPPEPPQPEPEPPKEQPQPKNPPPPDTNPLPEIANATSSQTRQQPPEPKDHEEIHVIHHHPPDHGYRYAYGPNFQQEYNGQWNSFHGGPQIRERLPQPPIEVTHSYNTYQPSPYVTEYTYTQSSPTYAQYSVPEYNTHYRVPEYNTRHSEPEYNTRHSAPEYNTRHDEPEYNRRYSASEYNNRYSAPEYNKRYTAPEYNARMPDYYNSREYYSGTNGNGNITSMFSEENPNACRIV